jgi:hypothetical protein
MRCRVIYSDSPQAISVLGVTGEGREEKGGEKGRLHARTVVSSGPRLLNNAKQIRVR